MANKEMYVVSFGNSSKYVTDKGETIKTIYDKVKEGMKKLFPSMDMDKLPEPEVKKVTNPSVCTGYEKLDLKAIPAILKCLATGHSDAMDLKILNRNAPWSDINPFK